MSIPQNRNKPASKASKGAGRVVSMPPKIISSTALGVATVICAEFVALWKKGERPQDALVEQPHTHEEPELPNQRIVLTSQPVSGSNVASHLVSFNWELR